MFCFPPIMTCFFHRKKLAINKHFSSPFLQNPRAQSLQKTPSFAHNSPPCFGVLIACFARNAVFFLIFERWYSFFVGGGLSWNHVEYKQ
jgi:hypothetical protein